MRCPGCGGLLRPFWYNCPCSMANSEAFPQQGQSILISHAFLRSCKSHGRFILVASRRDKTVSSFSDEPADSGNSLVTYSRSQSGQSQSKNPSSGPFCCRNVVIWSHMTYFLQGPLWHVWVLLPHNSSVLLSLVLATRSL